jgi:hypothetical protein
MSSFAQGKYALAISDRSGLAFPYNEMVTEWNGAFVHVSEFEPKQPQLEPKPINADPQALQKARPARTEFPTEDFLPENPLITASNTTLKIDFPYGNLQVNDQVRLRNVKTPVGGVAITTLQLATTLNETLTASDTTITLTDASEFPTLGYIVIEKVNAVTGLFENETIEYTGKSAGTHPVGAKVYGSYKVISLNTSTVNSTGQPSTSTQFDGINVTLVNAATSTETGGGFQCTIGPVNDKA